MLPLKTDDSGPRLHVTRMGLSMGGMIALEAALMEPSLVKTLILAGTTCQADRGLTTDPEVLALFATLPELSDMEDPDPYNADVQLFIQQSAASHD